MARTRLPVRGTLGTAIAIAILVACASDPIPRHASPPTLDASVVVDAASGADAVAEAAPPPTALVVGIDVDPYASADLWEIDVTTDDGQPLASESTSSPSRELRVEAPPDRPAAKVRIELRGRTHVTDQPDAILGPRVATAAFVPGHTKLAYLYLDNLCAYGAASLTCAADQTCADGVCKPQAMGDLPEWVPSWRDDPPSPCSPDATPELLFGDGNLAFTPKNDGDTMTMNCGGQGGHHLWVGVRMRGLPQNGVGVTVSAAPVGDAGPAPYPVGVVSRFVASTTPGTCELVNIQFQLDQSRPYTDYLDQSLAVTVRAEKPSDPKQRTATISRHVRISPTLDPASCGQ